MKTYIARLVSYFRKTKANTENEMFESSKEEHIRGAVSLLYVPTMQSFECFRYLLPNGLDIVRCFLLYQVMRADGLPDGAKRFLGFVSPDTYLQLRHNIAMEVMRVLGEKKGKPVTAEDRDYRKIMTRLPATNKVFAEVCARELLQAYREQR